MRKKASTFMELIQQFSFSGTFLKKHEYDNSPVHDLIGNICCYRNGLVLLEIDTNTARKIHNKIFTEKSLKFPSNIKNLNPWKMLENPEKIGLSRNCRGVRYM